MQHDVNTEHCIASTADVQFYIWIKHPQSLYCICGVGNGNYLVDCGAFIREKHHKLISAIEQAVPTPHETQRGNLDSIEARIGSLGGVTEKKNGLV